MSQRRQRNPQQGDMTVTRILDFSGGKNSTISPSLLKDTEAQICENVSFEQKGTLSPLRGRSRRYAANFSSNPCTGLGVYYRTDGTSRLLVASGTELFSDAPNIEGRWNTQGEWESGQRHHINTAAVPGNISALLNPPANTFARNSNAHNADGSIVTANVPRYRSGRWGNGAFMEEATINLLRNAGFNVGAGTVADGWDSFASAGTSIPIAPTPAIIFGGAMVFTNNDFIYALRGNQTTDFWRYSISGNAWTSMASTPVPVSTRAAVWTNNNFIYILQDNSSTGFWRYSISGNNWVAMAPTPATVSGGAMVFTNNDFIYALRSSGSNTFWRYSISGNNWVTMAPTPEGTVGTSLVWTNNDFMYTLREWTTNTFWRYSISGNNWVAMAPTPATVSGGAMVFTNNDFIYALRGSQTTDFWRYSISGNNWVTMAPTLLFSFFSSLVFTNNNFMYALRGDFTTNFWRYNINTNIWSNTIEDIGATFALESTIRRLSGARSQMISISSAQPVGNAAVIQSSTVTAGTSYVLSVYQQGTRTGSGVFNLVIEWLNASGVLISSISSPLTAPSASFTRTTLTGIAPTEAVTARALLRVVSQAVNDSITVYYDDAQLEAKETPTSEIITNDTTTQAVRVRESLHYTLPTVLPAEFFVCGWFYPAWASTVSRTTPFRLLFLGQSMTDFYSLEFNPVNDTLNLIQNVANVQQTIATVPLTFAAGASIFFAVANLSGVIGDVPAGFSLWTGVAGGALTRVTNSINRAVPNINNIYVGTDVEGTREANGTFDALQVFIPAILSINGIDFNTAFVNNQYNAVSAPTINTSHALLANLDGALTAITPTGSAWLSPVMDVSQATNRASGRGTISATLGTGSVVIRSRSSADSGNTWTAWSTIGLNDILQHPVNNHIQTGLVITGNAVVQEHVVTFDGNPITTSILSGMTAGAEYSFTTLRDILVIVNGRDAPRRWTGSGSATLLGGNPPMMSQVVTHNNRVWGVETANSSRVRFSGILNPESWDILNFIDFNPEDGDAITCLHKYGQHLIVSKRRSMALLTGDQTANYAVVWLEGTVGVQGLKGIVNADKYVTFIAQDGIRFTDLTQQVLATERLLPDWDNINRRRLNQGALFYWRNLLLASLPGRDSLTNNTFLVYDFLRNAWSDIPVSIGWNINNFAVFTQFGEDGLFAADSRVGQIYRMLTGLHDIDGSLMRYRWRSKSFTFMHPERYKLFRGIFLDIEGIAEQVTLTLRFFVDGVDTNLPYITTIPAGAGVKHTRWILPPFFGAILGSSLALQLEGSVGIHGIAIQTVLRGIDVRGIGV